MRRRERLDRALAPPRVAARSLRLFVADRCASPSRRSAAGASLAGKVAKLQAAGAQLSARADAQMALPVADLERRSGVRLSRSYRQASGGGDRPPAPWVVDEFAPWYKAHERGA